MKRKPSKPKDYPQFICHDCAVMFGGKWPEGHMATMHMDICPICEKMCAVTQPRDYGHLPLWGKK